ncbi:hypothetical protein RJD24_17405 [Bacillaceae bacterium IKA-2]|jgi:peroxiredoxin|nr:hypothetical protein RJD24_17405 [Bacillaceae bacterium IKA-2]
MYAISYSTPEEHTLVQETFNLVNFEFLSDYELEFGEQFGFFDKEENYLYRGYVGANPDADYIVVEIDYLVGDNSKEIISSMD